MNRSLSEPSLREWMGRLGPSLLVLAHGICHDRHRAEEIVQEVFVRLWNEPNRYDPERGTLRSFLLAHTHGRSVDLIRADASRRKREEKEARQQAVGGYDISHEVWDIALAGHVREAMETLQQGEREAIELAYFGGLTYKEAAERLGEPEGTVKSRIRSGLKRLRVELVQAGVSIGAD